MRIHNHYKNNMADKRRGKHTASNRKGEILETTDRVDMEAASSEDEAPEEVTFQDSKVAALRGVKEAIESARRNKEVLKEKRRRRHELFQQQKKKRRLPDELLREIESAASEGPKENDAAGDSEANEVTSFAMADDSCKPEEEEGGTAHTKKTPKKRRIKGRYMVMRLKDDRNGSKLQESAANFIQSRLYGAGACRISVSQFLSLEQKSSQNKGAAVQFRKQWRGKQEENAVKFKKQWLHKQSGIVS